MAVLEKRFEYFPGAGVLVTMRSEDDGLSVLITDNMTIAAIANHLRELEEWLT